MEFLQEFLLVTSLGILTGILTGIIVENSQTSTIMAILERKHASEWTRDWFPPRVRSIKIDVVGRNVDVMDTFLLLYGGTQSSAASLQSKWFGEKTIDAAMQTVSLLPIEACRVVWTLPSGDVRRRIVPLDGMVRILKKIGTPTALKLAVDMESALDELTQGGAIVVSGLRQTTQKSTLEASTPMVATTTAPPNTMIPLTPRFPVVDSSILQVSKFNSSVVSIGDLIERGKKQKELMDIAAATYVVQQKAALAAELAQVEQTAKKRKIEEESDHESHQASELAKIKTIGICDAERDKQLKELISLHEMDNNQEMLQQLNDLVKQRWENTKERLLATPIADTFTHS